MINFMLSVPDYGQALILLILVTILIIGIIETLRWIWNTLGAEGCLLLSVAGAVAAIAWIVWNWRW